jgi:hypothetical protein
MDPDSKLPLAKRTCDECRSDYFAERSTMASLCPECAHRLYGYPRCAHVFIDGRCRICHWDGSTSDFAKTRR